MRTVEIAGVVTTRGHATQTESTVRNESKMRATTVFGRDLEAHVVPYISGSSVRGRMRRIAGMRILDQITNAKSGVPVTRDLAMNIVRGSGGRGGIARDLGTPKILSEASRHAFVGLFGGGPLMFASRFSVQDLVPLVEWTRHIVHPLNADRCIGLEGLRYSYKVAGESEPRTGYLKLTTMILMAGRDDFRDGSLRSYVANHDAQFVDWVTSVAKQQAQKQKDKQEGKKGDAVGKTDDLRFFGYTEALLPGTPLNLHVRLDNPTDAQVGLLLETLLEWTNENKLGGGSARGLGRFAVTAALVADGKVEIENLFSGDAPAYTLSPDASRYTKAWGDCLRDITAAEMEQFYPSVAGVTMAAEEVEA